MFVPLIVPDSFTITQGSFRNALQVVALYRDDGVSVLESAENRWPRVQSRGHVVDFAQFRRMKEVSHS